MYMVSMEPAHMVLMVLWVLGYNLSMALAYMVSMVLWVPAHSLLMALVCNPLKAW